MKQLSLVILLSLFVSMDQAQVNNHDEVDPEHNLVIDGIPKIPAALNAKVTPYRTFYPSSLLGWDPIKHEVIISRFQFNATQAARVTQPGNVPKFFTSFPTNLRFIYWHPKGK